MVRSILFTIVLTFLLTSCEGPVRLKYFVKNNSSSPVIVMSTGEYDSVGYRKTITDTEKLPINTRVNIAQGSVMMAAIKKEDRFHDGLDSLAIRSGTVYAKIDLLNRKYWQLTWDSSANYELLIKDEYFK